MKQHFANLVEEEESAIDMTPMLDVVFIMLIFFIVTASFVKESGIDVNRPDAATAVQKNRANILVAISDRMKCGLTSVRLIYARFRRISNAFMQNPQGSVVIQADEESNTKTLIEVMDAARAAGVFDVSVATDEQ